MDFSTEFFFGAISRCPLYLSTLAWAANAERIPLPSGLFYKPQQNRFFVDNNNTIH